MTTGSPVMAPTGVAVLSPTGVDVLYAPAPTEPPPDVGYDYRFCVFYIDECDSGYHDWRLSVNDPVNIELAERWLADREAFIAARDAFPPPGPPMPPGPDQSRVLLMGVLQVNVPELTYYAPLTPSGTNEGPQGTGNILRDLGISHSTTVRGDGDFYGGTYPRSALEFQYSLLARQEGVPDTDMPVWPLYHFSDPHLTDGTTTRSVFQPGLDLFLDDVAPDYNSDRWSERYLQAFTYFIQRMMP